MNMKWTKERDKELIDLISQGKRHNELAVIFNTSQKSIANRCYKLNIKTIYHKEFKCKQCDIFFIDYVNSDRLFCSHKCSAEFSNTNREHSEETKDRISKSLSGKKRNQSFVDKIIGESNPNWKNGKSIKNNNKQKDKIDNKRKCKYCSEYKIEKKHKIICDDCRVSYYKFYRPSCEFTFVLSNFPNEFDFELIKKYGWYSPVNKKNNLNGVSRDHLYTVRDGFINKIDSEVIKHPANCRLLKHTDNNLKNHYSSITLEQLLERISKWNEKHSN